MVPPTPGLGQGSEHPVAVLGTHCFFQLPFYALISLLHSESCSTCAGLAVLSTKHTCHSVLNRFKVRVLKMWFDRYGREQSVWRLFIANKRLHK